VRRKAVGVFKVGGDSGAGTVLALALIGASLAAVGWVSVATRAGVQQLELQALADRLAIAADEALRGKFAKAPCELAKEISVENHVNLDTCRIVETKVLIELHTYVSLGVSIKVEPFRLKASAAAEPKAP
jgi:secretion/DNA translocation related TadE-like protein